jgi:heat shock protein HspQ
LLTFHNIVWCSGVIADVQPQFATSDSRWAEEKLPPQLHPLVVAESHMLFRSL